MKLFKGKKKEDLLEVLKKEHYGSSKFRKALEQAYMSDSFEKYSVGNNVIFKQGAGRSVAIPIDIVEDIVGMKLIFSKRAA